MSKPPAELISQRIETLNDWRGKTLTQVRKLIMSVDANIIEEWKWEVPVWSKDGIICTGESYKKAIKLTFPKGASLEDPAGIFNASLEGNARRAIDIHEGELPEEKAFKALIRSAIDLNESKLKKGK